MKSHTYTVAKASRKRRSPLFISLPPERPSPGDAKVAVGTESAADDPVCHLHVSCLHQVSVAPNQATVSLTPHIPQLNTHHITSSVTYKPQRLLS